MERTTVIKASWIIAGILGALSLWNSGQVAQRYASAGTVTAVDVSTAGGTGIGAAIAGVIAFIAQVWKPKPESPEAKTLAKLQALATLFPQAADILADFKTGVLPVGGDVQLRWLEGPPTEYHWGSKPSPPPTVEPGKVT